MSASVFELQGSISMDSSGFEKAIRDAIAEGKNLVKSLADNTAQMKALQDSVNKVKAQLDSAEKSMKETADATATMAKETDKSADATGDLSKEVEGLKSDLSKAENALEDTAKETKTLGERMDKTEKEAADLKEEVDNLKEGYDKAEKETNELDDDTKKLGKTADDTSEKFARFANFMKTGFVAALKVGIGAIAAATTAVAGVVTKSVSAYGEYEQYAGGIKSMLKGDQTAIEQVMGWSENAWQTMNQSQTEYLESFTNAYAIIKASIGDENAARETTNKLLQLESDLVATFGHDSEYYANAINWALKGSYNYLDNLNIGLAGTKEGFLENVNASGLFAEEVKSLDDLSAEDITAVIEAYADAAGVLGRTKDEAGATLTGSIGSVKAAWNDLVVAFSDPDADLDVKLKNFTDSAEAAIKNIVPTIQNALSGIGTAVQSLAPVLATEAPKLIGEMLPPLVTATTTLISNLAAALPDILKSLIDPSTVNTVLLALQDMWAAVWQGIQALTEEAPDIIPDLLNQIGNALLNSIDMLTSPIADIIYDIGNLIQRALPVLIPIVIELLKSIFTSVASLSSELFPALADIIVVLFETLREQDWGELTLTLINALSEILAAVAEAGEIIADELLPIVTTVLNILIDEFEKHGEEFKPALEQLLINLAKAAFFLLIDTIVLLIGAALIPIEAAVVDLWYCVFEPISDKLSDALVSLDEWFEDLIKKVGEKASDIVSAVTAKITGLIDTAKNWGKDLIDNFVGGIGENIGKVTSAVSGIADSVKDFIGFSEPDKGALANFHTFAPDMMQLFAQGIADNANLVYDEINDLTNGISNDLAVEASPVAPTVATNGTVNNFSVNVSFDGATISENTDLDNLSDTLIEKISEGLAMLDVFQTRAYGGVTI